MVTIDGSITRPIFSSKVGVVNSFIIDSHLLKGPLVVRVLCIFVDEGIQPLWYYGAAICSNNLVSPPCKFDEPHCDTF